MTQTLFFLSPQLVTKKRSCEYKEVKRKLPTIQKNCPQNKIYLTSILILDFPASKTVKNKFLLLKHQVYSILLWQPKLTTTVIINVMSKNFILSYYP